MKGMGRPREAIDAAVLAAAKSVDRTVEANVRRAVAGKDRLGMLDRDCGSPARNAVQRFHAVQPIGFNHPLLEIEAGRSRIACCSTPVTGLDRHRDILRRSWNISRTF